MNTFKEPFIQKLLNHFDLTATQRQELEAPQDQQLEGVALTALVDFFKEADKVMICGDYDCDGIAATSIAVMVCKKLGLEVGYYIPDRIQEGYGVRTQTIDQAATKGYTDILILDNGVKAYEARERITELGLRCAIVDHHLIAEPVLEPAFLHPDRLDAYFQAMCAGGLIACVAEALAVLDDRMIALAAVATIADVMPLWGKNREWVRRGLSILQNNHLPWFDLLVKRNRYTVYSSQFIAFQLVPKINSIGRLSDRANVNTAVHYFTTPAEDLGRLQTYSQQVLALNDVRKKESQRLKEQALALLTDDPVQIVVHESFHEGLLGIVANQVAQATQKPSIILTEVGDTLKGSARSMSISLQSLFEKINPDFFVTMGGHDFAYGMTLHKRHFAQFKKDVNAMAPSLPNVQPAIEPLHITFDDLNPHVLSELRALEPFGAGFKLPTMVFKLPDDRRLETISHYGYKYKLPQAPIQEAVYFTQEISRLELETKQFCQGTLDVSNPKKVTFFIEKVL